MTQLYTLLEVLEQGFPKSMHELPSELHIYYKYRDHLCSVDGVITYKNRILIPKVLQQQVLDTLHSAHQGVTSMMSRAKTSIFWPGATLEISKLRDKCIEYNRITPSQPDAPPVTPQTPDFPFQLICADYFQYMGKQYLVIVDRYSNWPIVEQANEGASGLIKAFAAVLCDIRFSRTTHERWRSRIHIDHYQVIPTNLGSVSQSVFRSIPALQLQSRSSSQDNQKINTDPAGAMNIDKFQRAMLQYRNTPDKDTHFSPAMCIFGRQIQDFIPILPSRYFPHATWKDTLNLRELALQKRHLKISERLSEHTRILPPLKVGGHVRIQNQTSNHPKKWDRTGRVVEVKQYHQYLIRVDGSGRITMRNRTFLRKLTPVIVDQMPTSLEALKHLRSQNTTPLSPLPTTESRDNSLLDPLNG